MYAFYIVAAFYVGQEFYFFAVLGLGGGFFEFVECALLAAEGFLAAAVFV